MRFSGIDHEAPSECTVASNAIERCFQLANCEKLGAAGESNTVPLGCAPVVGEPGRCVDVDGGRDLGGGRALLDGAHETLTGVGQADHQGWWRALGEDVDELSIVDAPIMATDQDGQALVGERAKSGQGWQDVGGQTIIDEANTSEPAHLGEPTRQRLEAEGRLVKANLIVGTLDPEEHQGLARQLGISQIVLAEEPQRLGPGAGSSC